MTKKIINLAQYNSILKICREYNVGVVSYESIVTLWNQLPEDPEAPEPGPEQNAAEGEAPVEKKSPVSNRKVIPKKK